MLKTVLIALLPLLVLFGYGTNKMITGSGEKPRSADTGTLEKMIVSNGSASLDLDMNRIAKSGRGAKAPQMNSLRFDLEHDSYFTVIVFNNELRGPLPSSMPIIPQAAATLPGTLNKSYSQLVVENTFPGSPYEYVIRDAKSGYVFFNVEGHEYDYDANQHLLSIRGGRVLLSNEYAKELGRPADTGTIVGEINISATMRAIEVAQVVNGEVANEVLPADPLNGTTPGPDVIDLSGGYLHPDLQPLKALSAALARAAKRPDAWQRPPSSGLPELRDWFAEEFTAFLIEGEEAVGTVDHFHGGVVAVLFHGAACARNGDVFAEIF